MCFLGEGPEAGGKVAAIAPLSSPPGKNEGSLGEAQGPAPARATGSPGQPFLARISHKTALIPTSQGRLSLFSFPGLSLQVEMDREEQAH